MIFRLIPLPRKFITSSFLFSGVDQSEAILGKEEQGHFEHINWVVRTLPSSGGEVAVLPLRARIQGGNGVWEKDHKLWSYTSLDSSPGTSQWYSLPFGLSKLQVLHL